MPCKTRNKDDKKFAKVLESTLCEYEKLRDAQLFFIVVYSIIYSNVTYLYTLKKNEMLTGKESTDGDGKGADVRIQIVSRRVSLLGYADQIGEVYSGHR